MPSRIPRSKGHKGQKNRKNQENTSNVPSSEEHVNENIDEMLIQILEYKNNDNFREAIKLARIAYAKFPDHEDSIDMLSELLYESGDLQKCKNLLQKAVKQFPNSGAQKFLMLGELESGKDSLQCYKHAISIMENDLYNMKNNMKENPEPEEIASMEVLQAAIAEAYCSIADLYMTDLPELEEAEQTCVASLEAARKLQPNSAHVLQTFASCRISQSMFDEARELMRHMLSTSPDFLEAPDQFKINTGRILLELDMLEEARKVFEELRHDDVLTPEIGYYSGITEKLNNNFLKALILFNKILPDVHGKMRSAVKVEISDCKKRGGQHVVEQFNNYLKQKEAEETMDTTEE